MDKKVLVREAAVAISLDGEQVPTRLERGCIVGMTNDTVAVRFSGNQLRLLDIRAFCSGSSSIRHVLELPQNVAFPCRISRDQYGVVWETIQEQDQQLSIAVYCVDFHAGELHTNPSLVLNEQIADSFVDTKGKQVAVVGATTGKLWGWTPLDQALKGQKDWRLVGVPALDAQQATQTCSVGRFVSSAVLGNCFAYIRATVTPTGVLMEKCMFDVESGWGLINFSSRTLQTTEKLDPTEIPALYVADTWKFAVLAVGKALYHFDVDKDLRSSAMGVLRLDHRVLDAVWIDGDVALALLLANGQISVACTGISGRIDLMTITTSSTMSKRLSLSTLMGRAVSTALRVVWVAEERQILVDFGTSCAAFRVDLADEGVSSGPDEAFVDPVDVLIHGGAVSSTRRVLPGRVGDTADFNDYTQKHLEGASSSSSNELLDIARIALARSYGTFEDLYFVLLRMLHQKLACEIIERKSSQDPIDFISESLKVMEVLVSFTISVEASVLRQISTRMLTTLPGCGTTSDRKSYYAKEIRLLSHHAARQFSRIKSYDDWWVGCMEANAFLQVYFARISACVQDISAEWEQKSVDVWRSYFSFCQRIIDHEDFVATAGTIATGYQTLPQVECLGLLMASYTLMCYCLQTNGILINLEHFMSILASPHKLKRMETLCCFAQPWCNQVHGYVSSTVPQIIATALQFADQANSLKLLMEFCLASGSSNAHICIQELCKKAESGPRTTHMEANKKITPKVNDLHLQTCETYIGEVLAILQRLGPLRQFRFSPREAVSSTGRLSPPFSIIHEFNAYREQLLGAAGKTRTDHESGSQTSSMWTFSSLDERLRARVIFLLSRIVWHVEAVSDDISYLSQRAFEMQLFAEQLESNEISDFISKAREVVMSTNPEIKFAKLLRSHKNHLPLRLEKIVRSLVMAAWALWHREKLARCRRRIHVGNADERTGLVRATLSSSQSTEKVYFGALVAVCALHLNSFRVVCGEKEDIFSLQLSLLEEAAAITASQTATIVAWGFPVQKVQARYLKRYKALRQVITNQEMQTRTSLEESEKQYQRLQKHGIQGIIQTERDNIETTTVDIEVLVNCCCDHDFQLIVAALTNATWEMAPIQTVIMDDSAFQEETRIEPEQLPPLSSSDKILPKPQLSENMISRDEVMALLQAQNQQLEEKIKSATTAAYREELKQQITTPAFDVQTLKKIPGNGNNKQGGQYRSDTLKEQQHIGQGHDESRKSVHNRTLSHHRQTLTTDSRNIVAVDKEVNTAVRNDSVRNALKLFRLRQESGGHRNRKLDGSNTGHEFGLTPINDIAIRRSDKEASSEQVPPKTKNLVPRRQDNRKHRSDCRPSKEPTYPLRLEYDTDSASLKLLGRDHRRNPSVQRKQFINYDSGGPKANQAVSPKTSLSADSIKITELKSACAQTIDFADVSPVEQLSPENDSGPEMPSPIARTNDTPISESNNDDARHPKHAVAIQCQLNEESREKAARRKHAPLSLNIADKYPIWVDLDNASTGNRFKERKKFIQVSQFANFGTAKFDLRTAGNDDARLFSVTSPGSTILVPRKLPSDNDSERNQSDGQNSPTVRRSLDFEDPSTDQTKTKTNAVEKYRASYQQRYPVGDNFAKPSDDRETGSGIETLLGLRDDMQQMTRRLLALETCANSIDDEFKASQKRLSQIGDKRLGGTSTRASILGDIDEVLSITKGISADEGRGQANSTKSTSILCKKAFSDLDAAKKLLGTIEQLTIAERE